MLGMAAASMLGATKSEARAYRSPPQTKQAFGGSSQTAVSRRAISTLARTAGGAPEVVVRITGRQHGGGHVLANFTYISRLGHGSDKELALYTSDGDVLRDGGEMQILAQDWHEWEMGDDARRKGATSISMILSMPTGTDPERLKEAALDFAREEFANRSWVASLHVDRDHPHVHLTVARRDLDGRRFHPNRDDLFRYRQRFAEKLRDRGIEANATPVKARGIDATHEPIAARKVREKGDVPRIDRSRAERAQRLQAIGQPDPVRTLLERRQTIVREAYERSIVELKASPSMVNQTVANSLQRFVDGMNEPEPNSLRAARSIDHDGVGGRDEAQAPAGKGAGVDPVADALARSNAMRDRIEARRTQERAAQPNAPKQPVRGEPDNASATPGDRKPDAVDDVVRQVLDRNWAQRDRDRDRSRDLDPHKGGPRR